MKRLWVFFHTVLLAISAVAEPVELTLEEAINIAQQNNITLRTAQSALREASASVKSARGRFGPKLSLDANMFVWDKELGFEMSEPSAEVMAKHADVLLKYGDLLMAFPELMSFGNIRDRVTSQISIGITQPLTPLYSIYKGYRIARLAEDAQSHALSMTKAQVTFDVTKAYLSLKQAQAGVKIAQAAVEQLKAHVAQAQAFYESGVIGRSDVMKVELALEQANQGLIQARSFEELAKSALALTIGRDRSMEINPVSEFEDPPQWTETPFEDLVAQAFRRRPELKALDAQVEMAEAMKSIAVWNMVPQVVGLFTYQHNEGMGFVYPKDSWFGGAALKWDFFEWGASYYQISASKAKAMQARLQRQRAEDGVFMEVKKAYLDLVAAHKTLEVTKKSLELAEENYRLEKARFEAHTNTATDLLDAQAALTRAKLEHTNALYNFYVAKAALAKAIGEEGIAVRTKEVER